MASIFPHHRIYCQIYCFVLIPLAAVLLVQHNINVFVMGKWNISKWKMSHNSIPAICADSWKHLNGQLNGKAMRHAQENKWLHSAIMLLFLLAFTSVFLNWNYSDFWPASGFLNSSKLLWFGLNEAKRESSSGGGGGGSGVVPPLQAPNSSDSPS